jgi:hypothetical protein
VALFIHFVKSNVAKGNIRKFPLISVLNEKYEKFTTPLDLFSNPTHKEPDQGL